jgi:hypothetical protein
MSITATRRNGVPPFDLDPRSLLDGMPRQLRRDRSLRFWMTAWAGAAVIGVGNGALREALFRDLGDERAHQVSTGTLLTFLALYMRWLAGRRPLSSRREALQVGAAWATATVAFETGLGLAAGDPLDELLGNYDVTKGRIWILVPLWMLLGPALVGTRRRGGER